MFWVLFFGALASKHPGFREEQEWRILYSPKLLPSRIVNKSIEIVRGQPLQVYKIPFFNREDLGVDWIELNQILDRVIIGPTENSHAVREAFIELLHEAEVVEPELKVVVSNIPLR